MNAVTFRNRQDVVADLVNSLMDEDALPSWNLQIPPGFGGGEVAHELGRRLDEHQDKPFVAVISAEGLTSPRDLVVRLHSQWSRRDIFQCPAHHDDPEVFLSRLLDACPINRRRIQIVMDFEKILGRLDENILVALRGAEQAGRLQTVTVSMYPYRWIKRAWKREGKMLHASKYGDTHWGRDTAIGPCSVEELTASPSSVPKHVLQFVHTWTGGCPGPFNAVMREWQSMAKADFTNATKLALYEVAVKGFADLAQYLEPDGEDRFRKLVVDLHTRIETTQSYHDIKHYHPWARVILDEKGLSADAFGEAVIQASIERAFLNDSQESEMHAVLRRGTDFYNKGQYDIAQKLLCSIAPTQVSAAYNMTRLHATIMNGLCQGPFGLPCVDSDWKGVLMPIEEARTVAGKVFQDRRRLELLKEQYDAMSTLASTLLALLKDGVRRAVDHLAGLTGDVPQRDKAFMLVVLQVEAARGLRGNSFACKAAMELPEQLIRLWAWWCLDVSYYSAPHIEHDLWHAARAICDNQVVGDAPPAEGTPFRGIAEFECFLKSFFEKQQPCETSSPWPDDGDLARDCSVFQIRNDPAHAVSVLNAGLRGQLFICIDRWVCVLEKDSRLGLSKGRALDLFSRLPLPDDAPSGEPECVADKGRR
ncbi:MAG: hypothetical protein WCQ26_11175 [Pseudanabaena sp. ELA748]